MISVLCVPVTGSFVDRLGRRRFQLIGASCMVLGCCFFALADSVGLLLVTARILQGVGFSFYFVAASTTAADLAPPARLSKAIGWFGATMVVTNALAPAIAEPLALAVGWKTIFWTTAAFAALAGAAVGHFLSGALATWSSIPLMVVVVGGFAVTYMIAARIFRVPEAVDLVRRAARRS